MHKAMAKKMTKTEEEILDVCDWDTAQDEPVAEQPEQAEGEAQSYGFESQQEQIEEQAVSATDEATERYQRLLADFENFKKRNAATAVRMYNEGVEDVLIAVLPTLDYLDMAIAAQKDESQRKGIELVKKTLSDTLSKYDVTQIQALGEEFDPNIHEAVMNRDDPENAGKVVEVMKSGYRRNDKILRHPMVVVGQ